MTNEEKYKTMDERKDAFKNYCHKCESTNPLCRENSATCLLHWLELEAVEYLSPCPFCGSKAEVLELCGISPHVQCTKCHAEIFADTREKAVAKWNRRTP